VHDEDSGRELVLDALRRRLASLAAAGPHLQGALFGRVAEFRAAFQPTQQRRPLVAKLNAAFNKELNDPAARAVLEKNSLLPSGGTPADYKAFVADQIQQWTKVARDNHIEAEQ
jgi:tripartite-type tricarboxylate transporter receptor subunit TctC